MSTEDNKALVQRHIETFNARDLDAYFSCFAASFAHHHTPAVAPDLEGMRQLVTHLLTTNPDFHITLEEMTAEGDRVVARVSQQTSLPFPGAAEALYYYRIVNGKIVELSTFEDTQKVVASMMR